MVWNRCRKDIPSWVRERLWKGALRNFFFANGREWNPSTEAKIWNKKRNTGTAYIRVRFSRGRFLLLVGLESLAPILLVATVVFSSFMVFAVGYQAEFQTRDIHGDSSRGEYKRNVMVDTGIDLPNRFDCSGRLCSSGIDYPTN